jgi:hypothetical protein
MRFTQVTGFSICHPMYDNKHMLKVVQDANASALHCQKASRYQRVSEFQKRVSELSRSAR